jgi:hypothetical protein
MQPLLRHSDDVFVVGDVEDTQSDPHLQAALALAKALSFRQATAKGGAVNFDDIGCGDTRNPSTSRAS